MLSKTKIKYIQSLAGKKSRDEQGEFIAEGPKLVLELIRERYPISEVFALKEWISEQSGLERVPVTEITEAELSRISLLHTPNKVLAVVKKLQPAVLDTVQGELVLALDNIQDPGNLGTIIRIADWFGVKYIACSTDCADIYNPKVVQATMGSLARVNVFYTDLASWLAKQAAVKIYATTLDGKRPDEVEPVNEGVLVIGNESKGINRDLLRLSTDKITIPRLGGAESLNAAVAAGIVLSHLLR